MASASMGSAYLVKRRYGTGLRWVGQIKYKDESGAWRTLKRALTDQDGSPIVAYADKVDADGSRIRNNRNSKAARDALNAWRASIGDSPTGGRSAVPDYIDAYLDGREGNVQPSTMRKYREYARLLRRGPLADVPMRDLDADKVTAWVVWMRSEGGRTGHGMAPASIRTAYGLLSQACAHAAKRGDIRSTPCDGEILGRHVPKPQTAEEVDATRPNALDAEGVRRANALLDATANGRLRVGARLALSCGLRAGEACGLRWRDVDLDAMVLRVANAVGRSEGRTYDKPPKTPTSNRTIPLPVPTARELAAWRDHQQAQWLTLADGQDGAEGVRDFADTYVCGWPDGRFMTPHALGNAWSRLVRAGDADGPLTGTRGRICTFHDLRHTFATHAIASGADAKSVATLMGHKDASVTLTIYADALPAAMRSVMDEMAVVLSAGSGWVASSRATGTPHEDGGPSSAIV